MIRPPAILMPTSTTSESVTITTAKSTTVGPPAAVQMQSQPLIQQPIVQTLRPFPVMPVIIKEEPVDYEVMSDITVETNTEALVEHMRNHRNRTNGIHSTTSTSSSSNQSSTPLPVHSMVSVNTKSLLLPPNSTDSEYISAYMLTPSSTSDKTSTSSKPAKRKSSASNLVALPKIQTASRQNGTATIKADSAKVKVNRNKIVSMKTRSTELTRLMDDSSIQNKTMIISPGRQTRQQLKEIRTINVEPSPLRSRSRNGDTTTNYKSYFFPSKVNRRKSMDSSIARRKGKSPSTKHANKSKSVIETGYRKRRSSMSQNRTRI